MNSIITSLKKKFGNKHLIICVLFFLSLPVIAQDTIGNLSEKKLEAKSVSIDADTEDNPSDEKTKEKKVSSSQKYRLLQSNDFLVDTAYLQEKGELQHSFTLTRTNRRNWSTNFSEEISLGSEKHQLSFSLPSQLVGNSPKKHRGFGDIQIEYNYGLFGDSESRITVSPGFGLSLPSGNARKELGAGATGVSFKIPVGVMLGDRLASNSVFETTYTKSAQNAEGARANVFGYEIGQSFVWFAKPKLNFLVEAVWEREQEVTGQGLKEYENEFLISPGIRWAHTFKNGLIVSPGVAVSLGFGPSRSERGIFFYLSFEHSFKKER